MVKLDLAKIAELGRRGAPTLHIGQMQKTAVRESDDLRRILALPVRQREPELYNDLRLALTKPGAEMSLWDEQCAALLDAKQANGLFAPLSVGSGKTLVCCLLPTVLGKKSVILTKASLRSQGEALMYEYKKYFNIRDDVRWVAYSTLSSAKRAQVLEDLEPELIIADECHAISNKDAARTKRFRRYMKAHPETLFCGLSGTICKRSIRDFAPLLELALGKEKSPLPIAYPHLVEWAEVLDVSDNPRPPGALMKLCAPGESAREGWRRRFIACAGVVASDENDIGCSLVIEKLRFPESQSIRATLAEVHDLWERPDGEPLTYALELARVSRQVRLGGFYRWKWPEDVSEDLQNRWLDCRSAYLRELRYFLQSKAKEGLDSPFLVEKAIEEGEVHIEGWTAWKTVRELVEAPKSEWVWICKDVVESLAVSLKRSPICCFVDVVEVGREIARLAGVPYYGQGEKAAVGIMKEKGDRSIVASIRAHGTGRNLQMFSKAIVAGGTPTGVVWEQMLGRLHRSGQVADEVIYQVLFPDELVKAREDARFVQETIGNKQKLLTAIVR